MKKRKKILIACLILIVTILSGCKKEQPGEPINPPVANIVVNAINQQVQIKDSELAQYNFTSLFTITSDNQSVEVLTSYLDTSKISTTPGTYEITCTYQQKQAKVEVIVVATTYEITLSQNEITIEQSQVENYDFNALFTVYVDNNKKIIDETMVTTNVLDNPGSYTYTVTIANISKTLKVNVIANKITEIICTYPMLKIAINEVATFDFTNLFTLYIDGEFVEVTTQMLDLSNLESFEVGKNYEVTLNYTIDNTTLSKTTIVEIVAEEELIITSKNIITYPNEEYIDLTTLFTIKKGNQFIPVTLDMISGSIDYSTIGTNTITLNYLDQTATATVEVKRGVIIQYAKSDTIVIVKGTNQNSYSFANDFKVMINGLVFTHIPDSYFITEGINFNEIGTYQLTIKIPYNENKIGLSGVKFTYYEKTINYVVVDNNYEINILNEVVKLPKDTTSYNVFKNLSVLINGKNQTLTTHKDYVDVITCYAEVLSEEIDFDAIGNQEVKIAIYANGVDKDPVIVKYFVIIESNVKIVVENKAIFAGTTLYTKDLFVITDNEEKIDVSYDMITGKVDTLTPGTYFVTINYLNLVEVATVIVYDNSLKGTYQTNLTTIPETSNDDDEDYGTEQSNVTKLKKLIISDDGSIVVNGSNATIISGVDEHTMKIMLNRYEYTLHYDNGIIILDPNNDIRLSYNNEKRPMIYFNENMWELEDKVIINNSSSHILELSSVTYSIDVFNIKSKLTSESYWYGLKIGIIEKTSSDTVYEVKWGKVEFSSNFELTQGIISSLVFDDDTYSFTMESAKIGRINRDTSQKLYAGKTFIGTIDGKNAQLKINQYEGISLYIDSQSVFSLGSLEVSSLENGGINYQTQTIFLYDMIDQVFSYKFVVDPEALTFTYVEKDSYFGKYENDNMYIFLDGYGSGIVNFDTKHYYETQFKYTTAGQMIELEYINIKPSFEHGSYAKLSIDPFMNVLKGIYFDDTSLIGETYENKNIIDGAIVKISSYKVGQDTDTVAKSQFYKNIEIITKDGVLDDATKANCIDTSRIRFNTPGFYQFTITITVNGVDVTAYYAIQILESIYENNSVVATYGSGVLFNYNSLSIDKYGQATLLCNGTTYMGSVKIYDDNTFTITALSAEEKSITVTGNVVAPGIILVKCIGSVIFVDYFTTGTSKVSGTKGFVLRELNVDGVSTYIYAQSSSASGEIVSVESTNGVISSNTGAILKVTTLEKEYFVKINNWADVSNGLILSDNYRGTYTAEGLANIEVDGFGSVKVGDEQGTYVLNGSVITVVASTTKVYRLNNIDYTYEEVDIVLDNSIIYGKTLSASYMYLCGDYAYTADTSFTFGDNGVVIVKSTSESHDSFSDGCEYDTYAPSFASKGNYLVTGNQLTITVNGETIVFVINDVLKVNEITCIKTTISSDAQGYFSIDTVFTV